MNKEIQDLAWSCLPKEFKEDMKKQYQIAIDSKAYAVEYTLGYLFGPHNLTSDAEGEEMLYVKAKTVREMYAANDRLKASFPGTIAEADADKINHILRHLFGPKCLPDEACNVASSDVASSKPKPDKPKFKHNVGDEVKYKLDGEAHKIAFIDKGPTALPYQLENNMWASESDLEPYTEPKETKAEEVADKAIKPVAEQFDNILRKSLSKERRQSIAVQLTCAMIPKYQDNGDGHGLSVLNEKDMIKCAYRLADILIAEVEKGGSK